VVSRLLESNHHSAFIRAALLTKELQRLIQSLAKRVLVISLGHNIVNYASQRQDPD
jgi:hypothetical protein